MRRWWLAGSVVLVACGPDDPIPPVDQCLITMNPAAVSLEITVDEALVDGMRSAEATCDVTRVIRNDSITRLTLDRCDGTTTSATIAIGSVPAIPLAIDEGDRLNLRYEQTRPDLERHRFVLRRNDDSVAALVHTGSAIPSDDFYAPYMITSVQTECAPVPQSCFAAVKRAIEVVDGGVVITVPTRHAADEGGVHVRVEQADMLVDQMGCALPPAWYDFVVTTDRPGG